MSTERGTENPTWEEVRASGGSTWRDMYEAGVRSGLDPASAVAEADRWEAGIKTTGPARARALAELAPPKPASLRPLPSVTARSTETAFSPSRFVPPDCLATWEVTYRAALRRIEPRAAALEADLAWGPEVTDLDRRMGDWLTFFDLLRAPGSGLSALEARDWADHALLNKKAGFSAMVSQRTIPGAGLPPEEPGAAAAPPSSAARPDSGAGVQGGGKRRGRPPGSKTKRPECCGACGNPRTDPIHANDGRNGHRFETAAEALERGRETTNEPAPDEDAERPPIFREKNLAAQGARPKPSAPKSPPASLEDRERRTLTRVAGEVHELLEALPPWRRPLVLELVAATLRNADTLRRVGNELAGRSREFPHGDHPRGVHPIRVAEEMAETRDALRDILRDLDRTARGAANDEGEE